MSKTNRYHVAIETTSHLLKELEIYEYLFDPLVTEIDINPDNKIFIQKLGLGAVNTGKLAKPEDTKNLIQVLASLESQVVNPDNPRISTILPIGAARFEGLVPPVALNPSCTIRKKIITILSLDDYISQGFLGTTEKDLIVEYVKKKKNILIVGGTNTGKTTFANAILKEMEADGGKERLLFIEDIRELQSKNDNNVFLQVIPGIFSPKDALKSALRYTPDRIIYGEVRGAEAFDLINAFNSGHKGGICTIHANDCRGGLEKVETYIMYEKDKPLSSLISRTIDVIITMTISKNKRELDSIAEVLGHENGEYILDFKYARDEESTKNGERKKFLMQEKNVFSQESSSFDLLRGILEENQKILESILTLQKHVNRLEERRELCNEV